MCWPPIENLQMIASYMGFYVVVKLEGLNGFGFQHMSDSVSRYINTGLMTVGFEAEIFEVMFNFVEDHF